MVGHTGFIYLHAFIHKWHNYGDEMPTSLTAGIFDHADVIARWPQTFYCCVLHFVYSMLKILGHIVTQQHEQSIFFGSNCIGSFFGSETFFCMCLCV